MKRENNASEIKEPQVIGLCLSEFEATQLIEDVKAEPESIPDLIQNPVVGCCTHTVLWSEASGPFLEGLDYTDRT